MQPQYRAYAQQAPQRSQMLNQRRVGLGPMMPSGPHPSVPLSQAQMALHQQSLGSANELNKRRSRKPTDKNLPDGVEETIINPDGVQRYRDLRDIERSLDATISRKRLDVCESVNRHHTKIPRILRLWISNTVEDQVWQGNDLNMDAFDFTPNMEASYRVKIEGRLVDEDDGSTEQRSQGDSSPLSSDPPSMTQQDDPSASHQEHHTNDDRHRFSTFFKAMSVDFDRSRFRNGAEQNIEWKKSEPMLKGHTPGSQPSTEFDQITFKRSGDENTNITINLYRHESPERYQLSPELADVIDMTEATQQEAVMGLWEYIRHWGLQEDEERRNFKCNEPLKRVVGRSDVGYIPMLNEYVVQHLRPLPPISLPYTIRVDEEFHKDPQPTVYDVTVLVDDPLRTELQPLINGTLNANMLKEITSLDDQLARLVQAIAVSKAKHSFFTSLSEDPATFVRNWLSSQKRDLEIIMGEASRGNSEVAFRDDWRKCGRNKAWATQNARESVNVLLSRHR
ncbi:hypothetical protein XA68_17980 [Ophiocordyceps unilateralis]|uniref:DM2 domain-containing protein n=1 Tax=Ophiocordyceps unilateralis TaxID=268505 RepID=A0A2A9P3Z8_OPHUN|nr:hypothetical protein XA68_17980 [Ophiocordyceps unilateralis]